jgi:hypothetical protein
MATMLRAAGLIPVRTIRVAFGQRYAIAALVGSASGDDSGAADTDQPPDPHGADDP